MRHQQNLHTAEKCLMGYNSVADTVGLSLYLHSFNRCWLPKLQNQAEFRQNLTLRQFKVIQGHRSWCQW